jgi:hypothetical protein
MVLQSMFARDEREKFNVAFRTYVTLLGHFQPAQ